ncbi:2',5'-phosphodiesterase 12 [Arctopsyche grandis]|uniref:2',5'-phosphodiesterase 12 n=1 Tax=Arctopsyche grandis TaxID=121162 RepID=UPI00406D8C4E
MIIALKACVINRVLYKIISRHSHRIQLSRKSPSNMEKAFFRHSKGEEQYHLTFLYKNEQLGVERQFNFMRHCDENMATLIHRINSNLQKVSAKKKRKNKKEQTTEEVVSEPISVKFFKNGEIISDDLICVDVMESGSSVEFQIAEKKFQVQVNAPWVTTISLPASILAGFVLYPIKFEGYFLEKNECKFTWYSGIDNTMVSNIKWEKIGDDFTYTTLTTDIGKRIKVSCIPGNRSTTGAEVEAVSPNKVEAGPGLCPFETRHLFTKKKLSGKMLRAVSYNILADLYCDSEFSRTELFPYCPPYALHIDYRKQLFIKEILGYNGDIVCLQEVDAKIFNVDLEPLLNSHSYEGCFTKKGGQVTEGLACFYRNDRFRLIDRKSCILGEELKNPIFKDIWSLIEDNKLFVARIEPRTTAVQGTILQSLENDNEIIVVGNTHFYFHPDADHVRLIQGGLTILWLIDIVEHCKKTMPGKRVSLLLCGDFNSVPSCGVYQLYTTGFVPSDYIDFKSNESEALSNVILKQSIPLASACGTPEFTNFTVGFADCLDYIFYNKECFDVVQIIPLPSNEELRQNSAIPSVVFPSDHVALVADLKFR